MKKRNKLSLVSLLVSILSLVLMVGCGSGGGGGGGTPTVVRVVTSVTLSAESISIKPGDSTALVLGVLDNNNAAWSEKLSTVVCKYKKSTSDTWLTMTGTNFTAPAEITGETEIYQMFAEVDGVQSSVVQITVTKTLSREDTLATLIIDQVSVALVDGTYEYTSQELEPDMVDVKISATLTDAKYGKISTDLTKNFDISTVNSGESKKITIIVNSEYQQNNPTEAPRTYTITLKKRAYETKTTIKNISYLNREGIDAITEGIITGNEVTIGNVNDDLELKVTLEEEAKRAKISAYRVAGTGDVEVLKSTNANKTTVDNKEVYSKEITFDGDAFAVGVPTDVKIVITSEDGNKTTTYVIEVTKSSKNANLKTFVLKSAGSADINLLSLGDGPYNQIVEGNDTVTIEYAKDATDAVVTATATTTGSSFNSTTDSTTGLTTGVFTLVEGSNILEIKVSVAGMNKVYTLTVTKSPAKAVWDQFNWDEAVWQ